MRRQQALRLHNEDEVLIKNLEGQKNVPATVKGDPILKDGQIYIDLVVEGGHWMSNMSHKDIL